MKKIVLASQSPRRKELLENIGVDFEVIVSDVDESIVPKFLSPQIYVQELAILKSNSVARNLKNNHIIIGADTIVMFNNNILGKPKDCEDAISMLKLLSGNSHMVYTGIAVIDTSTGIIASTYEKTKVDFKEISHEEILSYVSVGLSSGKAGSYGIGDRGGLFVKSIEGDFFNVVGLPLYKLSALLKDEFDFII